MSRRATAIDAHGVPAPADASNDALTAIVHRARGGLNSAALAFELILRSPTGVPMPPSEERAIRMGLNGIHQAARALGLLRELTGSHGRSDGSPASIPLSDVAELAKGHAVGCGIRICLPGDAELAAATATAAQAMTCVKAAFAVINGASPGDDVAFGIVQVADGSMLIAAQNS